MTSTDTRRWYRRARAIGPAGFVLGFVVAAAQNVPPTTEPTAVRTTTVTVTASAPRGTATTPVKTTPAPPAPAKAAPQTVDQDGTYLVGDDIQPGRWRTAGGDGGCYWARLSNTDGDDDIIANSYAHGRTVVTIKKTDVAFKTSGCGTWTRQ